MSWGFEFRFGGNKQEPVKIERDVLGNIFYTMFSSSTALGKVIPDSEKLKACTQNPALLKVISLDCDIFSMGKVNQYNDEKLKEKDFLYTIRKQPNLKQNWTQFFWDFKFWLNIYGNAYLYNPNNSKDLSSQAIQWLDPTKIVWDSNIYNKLKNFVFSVTGYNELMKSYVRYNIGNGETKNIRLDEIVVFYDLTNAGQDNVLGGVSRIDALFKIIKNSELSLDAKSINLEFTQKFLVAGKHNPDNISDLPMGEAEKKSIEGAVLSNNPVTAVKSMIDIKRYVDDMAKLKLDESFYNDFFMFGSMYNIPRDILETSLRGATFENQEKSMARLIEYAEAPKAKMFTDWLESQYGFQDVRMSWSDLMFNQVFEKERADRIKVQIENIKVAREINAISEAEAKKMINQLFNT